MASRESIANSWRRLLIDVAFMQNYPQFFSIASVNAGPAPRNPVMEELLPSLLQIKAVTVLDEALRSKLEEVGERPKDRGLKNDLNGRIETALAAGLIHDAGVLHRARNARNDVAHEFDEKIDWKRLDEDVNVINETLKELGYVVGRPVFQVYSERVPKEQLTDPNAIFGFNYAVQVRSGAATIAEITWSQEILGMGE